MSNTDFVAQEELVIAHLFWAVVSVQQVTVAIAGRAISGRLLVPDPDARAVVFEVTPGQALPERALKKGKVVLVKYASLLDEYQFKTQLLEVGPAKWMMAIPRDIQRSDRRMLERQDCHNARLNTVQVIKPDGNRRTLLVRDISPAGMGVVFDPKLDDFEEGQVLRGDLHMLGHDTVAVRFEVVSMQYLDDDASHRMLGCRFVGLGFSGCEQIARALGKNAS